MTRRAESLRRWKENGGRVGLSEWDFLERVGGDANGTNGMNGMNDFGVTLSAKTSIGPPVSTVDEKTVTMDGSTSPTAPPITS